MKLDVDSAAFADAVAWATRILPSRPATPILAGIKLEARNGELAFSTFDYEKSARHHIEAAVDEDGTIVVLGKLLADIAKALPQGTISLQTANSRVTISGGKSKFSLQLMPESDYPQLPEIPAAVGQVDAETFSAAVNKTAVAVAREENRIVLKGIRVNIDGDKVVMTSTDRFRLARTSFTWTPENSDFQSTLLIDGSVIKDISRSLDTTSNVVLGYNPEKSTLLSVSNAGRQSTAQLIDGEFPAVDRLFVDEYPIHAVINRSELISAITRVALVAEKNAPIRMVFTNNEVQLSAGSADESQAKETIDAQLDGEAITVAFNPSYLKEGLGAIDEPYVRMKMVNAARAVEFNGQQELDGDESLDYRYLLVPMRFID
ncbi:DNA polymerase III subunit beta [Alloscardovia macacae]|uniref:Beta sliding clamp n=1 Tax=Alloscardovia macacae TaxID=1160091 RepID=A0A1Y2SYN2_9BIFI|nr:DNA polymerase III subunit beta [Alloscardovia macacae]OTA26818.1 DNA polymerase III subunit beta [Alloscardovia macacae]OTA29158.1 DNA polymerase III subunit beta [Alloscardovia macacae]